MLSITLYGLPTTRAQTTLFIWAEENCCIERMGVRCSKRHELYSPTAYEQ